VRTHDDGSQHALDNNLQRTARDDRKLNGFGGLEIAVRGALLMENRSPVDETMLKAFFDDGRQRR
jgi:hypothetical protein